MFQFSSTHSYFYSHAFSPLLVLAQKLCLLVTSLFLWILTLVDINFPLQLTCLFYFPTEVNEMESENFQFTKVEKILIKVCMEKILRKILESFFYFVSFVKGKISKISDLQERKKELENLMIFDENKKINFQDLKANSKSYFGLPYYFDYYTKSLNCLSNDKDLKEAELEERKRLANELASYVMQNKVIHLENLIKDDSFSLILKFSEMLLNHVFDVKKIDVKEYKFKNSFLAPKRKKKNKKLYNFRNDLFPTDKKDTEGFIEFLGEKTITINIPKNSECKSLKILSEELVLSVMLEKPFDIKAKHIHDQKIIQKLNKFMKENVIDLGSKKLKETFLSDNFEK
ncbi:hypothetical protein Avbf_17943 [Armadillidium vulgare]|nr:hypothetical protein Avbf_17943 [Armadillidium vulgare]